MKEETIILELLERGFKRVGNRFDKRTKAGVDIAIRIVQNVSADHKYIISMGVGDCSIWKGYNNFDTIIDFDMALRYLGYQLCVKKGNIKLGMETSDELKQKNMENKDIDFKRLGELLAALEEKERFLKVLDRALKSEENKSSYWIKISYLREPIGALTRDTGKYIQAIADLVGFDIMEIKNEIRGLYGN